MKVFNVQTKHQFGLLKSGGLAWTCLIERVTFLHREESKFESWLREILVSEHLNSINSSNDNGKHKKKGYWKQFKTVEKVILFW